MKLKMTLAVAALLTIGLSSAAALADTVTVTVSNPIVSVSNGAGGTVTYDLTISAPGSNGADVYLNGDSFNDPFSVDDSDFFGPSAPFLLAPGSSDTFDAFTVTVPAGTTLGDYAGSFTVLGGADGGANDVLGTASFSTTVTPEPSSFLLLGTGFAGVLATLKKKRLMA